MPRFIALEGTVEIVATMVRSEFERLQALLDAKTTEHNELLAQMGPTHDEGGGWHDNSAFDQLKREERDLDARVLELKTFLTGCTVVERKLTYTEVEVGCIVTVTYLDRNGTSDGDPVRLQIVGDNRVPAWSAVEGPEDRDPFPVSTVSPIGSALMGATPGDVCSFRAALGTTQLVVLSLI
jgi:transcription elongation GreA/GreB family factor